MFTIPVNKIMPAKYPMNYWNEFEWPAKSQRQWDERSVGSLSSESSVSSASSTKSLRYKTEKCRQFYETGQCDYGHRCLFAHGLHELNDDPTKPKNYKTRVCTKFQYIGFCEFGSRCSFIHLRADPVALIRSVVDAQPRVPMPENKRHKTRPEFYPSDILLRKPSRMAAEEDLLPSAFIADHRLPTFARLTQSHI